MFKNKEARSLLMLLIYYVPNLRAILNKNSYQVKSFKLIQLGIAEGVKEHFEYPMYGISCIVI